MGTKCFRQFFQMPGYDHDMNWNAHFATEIIYFRTVNVSLTKAVRHLTWLMYLWTTAILSIHIFGCLVELSDIQMLNNSPDWMQICLSSWLTGPSCNQTPPADWLSGQTVEWMSEWMSKCPDMPTIWIEMHIWETWKSFSQTSRFTYKRPINRPAN